MKMKIRTLAFLLALLLCFTVLFTACKDDPPPEEPPQEETGKKGEIHPTPDQGGSTQNNDSNPLLPGETIRY